VTTTFDQESEAYAWVHEHMPHEEPRALAQFVAINPHQRGTQWWDVLSILRDCDAHLDVVEPMAEMVKDQGGQWTVLHSFVTYTMLYASPVFAAWSNDLRVIALRTTLNDGGGS
jgi:hypothetical protein